MTSFEKRDSFADDSPLAATDAQVAALTRPEREERVRALVTEAMDIYDEAVKFYLTEPSRELVGSLALFSGGNDSTVLAHLMRSVATHAAHANTTIGIEETRQFVRETCAAWDLPLIERTPPKESDHYRALVLEQGFPGPGHHYKMFQRLKERALNAIRAELVSNPRRQRLILIAGRRRQESKRRADIPAHERVGSAVWVSPLVNWTKLDMNTYRLMQGDVPTNLVSDLIHMSGECLCGSFASPGERHEVGAWFPEPFAQIAELEALIADREDIPEKRKTWGHASDQSAGPVSKSGRLCSSCDSRFAAEPAPDSDGDPVLARARAMYESQAAPGAVRAWDDLEPRTRQHWFRAASTHIDPPPAPDSEGGAQ